jgi:transposase
MEWSEQQLAELTDAARYHPKPGVRVKVVAVRAVAMGRTRKEAAELCATTRQSVGDWVERFQTGGVAALTIAPGRGRKSHVDEQQLEHYALQSPRNFGINRSRWRLADLAQAVPTLKGFSVSGVRQALKRCGISFKRGQPWMLSPDPNYEKKDR